MLCIIRDTRLFFYYLKSHVPTAMECLPYEIWHEVLCMVSIKEHARASGVCRRLHPTRQHLDLWRLRGVAPLLLYALFRRWHEAAARAQARTRRLSWTRGPQSGPRMAMFF